MLLRACEVLPSRNIDIESCVAFFVEDVSTLLKRRVAEAMELSSSSATSSARMLASESAWLRSEDAEAKARLCNAVEEITQAVAHSSVKPQGQTRDLRWLCADTADNSLTQFDAPKKFALAASVLVLAEL
eukprot:6185365-Pleurochrysis_carterae.AAC.6